jgi:hypothetical protein
VHEIVRLVVSEPEDQRDIEDDLALAIFAAECLYGRPQTRLELRYQLDADGGRCVAEVHGPAGEAAVRVLVGLVAARHGEGGFSVERLPAAIPAAAGAGI